MTTNKSREFIADSGREITPFLVLDYSFLAKQLRVVKQLRLDRK